MEPITDIERNEDSHPGDPDERSTSELETGTKSEADEVEDESRLSKRDIRRNMLFIILLDTIWITGYQDFSLALQPLLVYLDAPNKLIGFILGATWLSLPGMFFTPWITRRFRTKKWYLFVVNIPYMAPIGLTGLILVMSKRLDVSSAALLMIVVGCVLAQNFFAGFVALPHNEYVAACIPATHRGRYTGLSMSTGAICSIASTSVGGAILYALVRPMSYGYLFLMTWIICQGGYWFALLAKEVPTPVEDSPRPWSKEMLQAFWNDKPFVRFLTVWAIQTVTFWPVNSFLMIYGLKELHMPDYSVATVGVIGLVIRAAAAAPSGAIVDKYGAKRVLPLYPLACAFVFTMLVFWRSPYAIYIGSGVTGFVGVIVGGTAKSVLQYGLPKPENRAGHFTIQLLTDAATQAIALIMCGFLMDAVPFRTAFAMAAVAAFLFYPFMRWMIKPIPDTAKDYS